MPPDDPGARLGPATCAGARAVCPSPFVALDRKRKTSPDTCDTRAICEDTGGGRAGSCPFFALMDRAADSFADVAPLRRHAMTNRSGCYAVAVITVSAILFPADAGSQTLARSFQDLQGIARQGDSILVTDGAGRRVRAKIEELTPSTLTVLDENGTATRLAGRRHAVIEQAAASARPVLSLRAWRGGRIWNRSVLTRGCSNECGLVPFWIGRTRRVGCRNWCGDGSSASAWRAWPATIYRRAAQSTRDCVAVLVETCQGHYRLDTILKCLGIPLQGRESGSRRAHLR